MDNGKISVSVCLLVSSCKQLGRFGWNLYSERWQTALWTEMDIRLRIAFNSQQYSSEGCLDSITSHFLIVPPSDFLTCWCWPYFVWCIFSVCCRFGNGSNVYIIHTIDRNGNPKECEWIGETSCIFNVWFHFCCNITSGYKTWGFHSEQCSDCSLLGCDTVWSCRWIPLFWRKMLSTGCNLTTFTLTLEMEAACFFEILASIYKSTQNDNSENRNVWACCATLWFWYLWFMFTYLIYEELT